MSEAALEDSSLLEPQPEPSLLRPWRRLALRCAVVAGLGLAGLAAWSVGQLPTGRGRARATLQQDPLLRATALSPQAAGDSSLEVIEGSRSYPSLFCWLVFMSQTYEKELVKSQFKEWLGIFTCEDYAAYSDVQTLVGTYPNGNLLMAVAVGSLEAPKASWGAMNAPVFLRVWGELVLDGRYLRHDFVVKVDPDTVFIPWRLQQRLRSVPRGKVCFFKNSDRGDIPMVGPLEVLSRGAVAAYAARGALCSAFPEMVAKSGEDGWLGSCMSKLGVEQMEDLHLLKNGLRGPTWDFGPCSGSQPAAFHPFKNFRDWMACKTSAER